MEPGYQDFEDKFGDDLKSALLAFKCLRYFDPAKINELQPSAGDLDDLQVLPFFSSAILADLKKELSTYLAAANGTSVDADKLEWWKNHAVQLPFWSTGCRVILLLQPTSAAAKQVLSLLLRRNNKMH